LTNLNSSKISFVLSASITVGVWFFIPLSREWLSMPFDLHAELTTALNPFDSTSQRIGHLIFVALIGVFSFIIAASIKSNSLALPVHIGSHFSQIVTILMRPHYGLVWILILVVFCWRWYGNVIPVFIALFSIVGTAYVLNNIRIRVSNIIFIFLSTVLIFYHLLLPLLFAPDFSHFELSRYVFDLESHYSLAFGAAERLIQGGVLLKNVAIHYGLFSPILIVALDGIFGAFDFADYLRLHQCVNIIFFTLCMIAYGKAAKWQMHILFFAALLILPWINNLPEWIATPNQSGLRYFGFSLTLLFFSYCSLFSANFRSIVVGILASFCVFLNTETGVVLFIVFTAFVFFTNSLHKWMDLITKMALFLITFAITMLGFLFFTTKILAAPPQFEDFIDLVRDMLMFLSGYGGKKLPFLALGFVLLSHAGYIVIRSTIKWRFSSLTLNNTVYLCIALAMIGWLAYYFNRPETRNLWTIIVLYGYLLIPLLDRKYFRLLYISLPRTRISIPVLLVIITVLPVTIKFHLESIAKTIDYLERAFKQDRSATDIYSGVILKKEVVARLQGKARYIESLPKELKFDFLSAFSFTMPIESQRSSFGLPQDVFTEVLSKADHEILLTKLIKSGPEKILFDDFSVFSDKLINRESYYNRWKAKIADYYHLEETTEGWHVFKKNNE
jgi:hypothetical protein